MADITSFREIVEHTIERRRDFFKLIFGAGTGYVCIAYKGRFDRSFDERYFEYPEQLDEMCEEIDGRSLEQVHVYFCPQLLGAPKRLKSNVTSCPALWADLDTCNPLNLQVAASISVRTSPGRYQAYWRLETPLEPSEAEAICLKIAYFHASQGADKSGWDLTQLLRVPYTPNYKYGDIHSAPVVSVEKINTALYRPSDFDCYPAYEAIKFVDDPLPEDAQLPDEPTEQIVERYAAIAGSQLQDIWESLPEEGQDWSTTQWKLAKICYENGMTMPECFVVLRDARCNKYARDRRPMSNLWTEVKKIYLQEAEHFKLIPTPTSKIPEIITEEEVRRAQARTTFVERYIKWATELSDAAPQYHQAGAFTLLSAIMSGAVRLPTSFGVVIPNIWFMILADTTLTRKSTSMRIAMNVLEEVSPEAVMATDGSVEGILSSLRDRARVPSIYLRDEFAGLLDAMSHKDYMAGMMETFTKLYDGDSLKRVLRKEEIKITQPVFLMYTAGTKTRIQNMLTEGHIDSGFIPRFIFITAVADPSRVRPVGPPAPVNVEEKEKIVQELFDINFRFNSPRLVIMPNGMESANLRPQFEAKMTAEAWDRYNKLESTLTNAALDAELDHLTPVYDRLAKSTLKAAILLAASYQGADSTDVLVTEDDMIHAIYYCRQWYRYANEIVNSIGDSQDERVMKQIQEFVAGTRELGVTRAEIMRKFKLDSRRADLLLTTLSQRSLIAMTHVSGQPRYFGE